MLKPSLAEYLKKLLEAAHPGGTSACYRTRLLPLAGFKKSQANLGLSKLEPYPRKNNSCPAIATFELLRAYLRRLRESAGPGSSCKALQDDVFFPLMIDEGYADDDCDKFILIYQELFEIPCAKLICNRGFPHDYYQRLLMPITNSIASVSDQLLRADSES